MVTVLITYTSEDGTDTTFDGAAETLTSVALNADNVSFDYVDENGATTNINLCNVVDNCETLTSLSFNAATNELEYSDEDGNTNTIDISGLISTVTDNNTNTNVQTIATHVSGDGTSTQIEETVTTLTDNGDGTFTYTSEDGTDTTFDGAAETLTSVALNADNVSFDYVDENGATTNINLCNVVDNCETVT